MSNRLREGRSIDYTKKIELLKHKIALKEQLVKEKRTKLKEESGKREKIMLLVNRNQQLAKDGAGRIYFPFVGVNCRVGLV